MKIVWDEPKRLANLEKHGLDLADLNDTFFDNALVIPSHNKSRRWVAVGVSIRGVIVVVFGEAGSRGHQHRQYAASKSQRKETLCRTLERNPATAKRTCARSATIGS